MITYDFPTLLGFWNKILICIYLIQKRLQDPKMSYHDADLKALQNYFNDKRKVLVIEKSLKEGI